MLGVQLHFDVVGVDRRRCVEVAQDIQSGRSQLAVDKGLDQALHGRRVAAEPLQRDAEVLDKAFQLADERAGRVEPVADHRDLGHDFVGQAVLQELQQFLDAHDDRHQIKIEVGEHRAQRLGIHLQPRIGQVVQPDRQRHAVFHRVAQERDIQGASDHARGGDVRGRRTRTRRAPRRSRCRRWDWRTKSMFNCGPVRADRPAGPDSRRASPPFGTRRRPSVPLLNEVNVSVLPLM